MAINYDKPITISKSEFAIDIFLFQIKTVGEKSVCSFNGIYLDGCLKKIEDYGVKKMFEGSRSIFVKVENKIIEEITPEQIKDLVFNYIGDIDQPINCQHEGVDVLVSPEKLREKFLKQSHLIFNETFLQHLSVFDGVILRDTRDKANFYFSNGAVEVTKEDINHMRYADIGEFYLWKSQIVPRVFNYTADYSDSHISRFVYNICNGDEKRIGSLRSVIGYLLHNYSNESQGQVAIFVDQVLTDLKNPQGGTGKGVLMNAIKQLRVVVKIDGKKFNDKSQFGWQSITRTTQVVWLDDVTHKFNFSVLHSTVTDGITVERKFKDAYFIESQFAPKFAITSNTMILGEGSTNRRRQHINELSDHYSKQIVSGVEEPIKLEHGCTFYSEDWDAKQWDMFYSFMVDCSHDFMRLGLLTYNYVNVGANKLRQSTSEDFYVWATEKDFKPDVKMESKPLFDEFKSTYEGEDSALVQKTFTAWMKQYAAIRNWSAEVKQSNHINYITFKQRVSV